MDIIHFCTYKERIVHDRVPFHIGEFCKLIDKNKPTKLFCEPYSMTVPFILLSNYNGTYFDIVIVPNVDKTPEKISADALYEFLEKQGIIADCFIEINELYGKYVQLNDRFETVHIWCKQLDDKNNGRFIPKEITEEEYLKEIEHSWNK